MESKPGAEVDGLIPDKYKAIKEGDEHVRHRTGNINCSVGSLGIKNIGIVSINNHSKSHKEAWCSRNTWKQGRSKLGGQAEK